MTSSAMTVIARYCREQWDQMARRVLKKHASTAPAHLPFVDAPSLPVGNCSTVAPL